MWGSSPILVASTTTLTSGQMDELWVAAVASGVLAYLFAVYSRRATGSYPWRLPPLVWGVLGVLVPVLSLLLEAVARLTTRPVPPPAADPYGTGGYFQSHRAAGSRGPAGPSSGWAPPPQAGSRWEPPTGTAPSPAGPWQPQELAPRPPQAGEPQRPSSDQAGPPPWQAGAHGPPVAPHWPPPLGPEAFLPQPGQPAQPGQPPYAGEHADPSHGPGQAYPHPSPAMTKPALPAPDGWAQPLPYLPAPTPPPLFGWYPDPTGRHEQRYWDGRQWSHRVSDDSVRGDDPLRPSPGSGENGWTNPNKTPPAPG